VGEPRVAPAPRCPGGEASPLRPGCKSAFHLDGSTDRGPALGVCIEQKAGPIPSGHGPRDEVCNRRRGFRDDRLVLPFERGCGLRILASGHDHAESALLDPRQHLDRKLERRRAELLEPEAVLLHEVECEAIATRRSGGEELCPDLDRLSRPDDVGEGRANAVPDDRVPERVEPVIRELNAFVSVRPPGRCPRVLEPQATDSRGAGLRLLELVGEPANGERSGGHGVLSDAVHREG